MVDYGIQPTGFVKKTLEVLQTELETKQRAKIDPLLLFPEEDPVAQQNGILGSVATELWENLEEVYHSFDPDAAEGDALRNLGALIGLQWGEASRSKSLQTITADIGTVIPAGSTIAMSGSEEIRFVLEEDFTAAAPVTTGVEFFSEETGPIKAAANSLTVIATPVVGWTSTTNPADAVPGQDIQTPQSFRAALKAEAKIRGGSTTAAIRADVLALNNQLEGYPILDVKVAQNTRSKPDANGLPPKSFEVMVQDNGVVDNDLIAQAILDSAPAGMYAHGNQIGYATDENGDIQAVRFSRPVLVEIEVEYTIAIDEKYPGDTAFKQKIRDLALEQFGVADDVIFKWVEAAPWNVDGVRDVKVCRIKITGGSWGTSNLAMKSRQRANFNTANIVVTNVTYEDH